MCSALLVFFSSRRRHTRLQGDWSSDVCSSDLHMRRAELATAQWPFAIILGCSDSRVPAEIVFDQGLGDLFVIRVAGNIVRSEERRVGKERRGRGAGDRLKARDEDQKRHLVRGY